MMPVVYTAVQRFDPACGERWHGFVEWSGLKQLREVVSLDLMPCPTVFGELTAEDWRHNVQEDFKITLFTAPGSTGRSPVRTCRSAAC